MSPAHEEPDEGPGSAPQEQTPEEVTRNETSFDARLARLEQIVGALEDGELDLEPAIERYKEGVALLKSCREVLGGYRAQVEELTREAESSVRPYDGDPDQAAIDPPGGQASAGQTPAGRSNAR